MIKVHYDTDQEALLRACDGHMFSIHEDLNGLRKSASSSLFSAADLDSVRPDKDHFLIHNVLVGDEETYGQNRNGDSFPKDACTRRVNTFVSDGANYREHRNRSPKQRLGPIKKAGFAPKERRIEIIGWWNKKAAEEEYEMAKAGKALSFSMSCRVPWDECSCCKNRAKRASAYCTHLADSMNQYLPEFQKYAFARNIEPTFYDNSRVRNPADRIAHYLEYRFGDDDLQKAAAAGHVISGADWAAYEGVTLPDPEEVIPFSILKAAMLHRLAAEEEWLNGLTAEAAMSPKVAFVRQVAPLAFCGELSEAQLSRFRELRPETLMREFAKRAAIMPFISFAAYAQGTSLAEAKDSPTVKIAARKYVPQVFTSLVKKGDSGIGQLFEAGSHFSAQCDNSGDDVQKFMDQVEQQFGIRSESLNPRVMDAEAPADAETRHDDEEVKSSSTIDAHAEILAEAYGQYQLRALCDMESISGADVSDSQRLVTVAGNRHIYR